MSLPTEVFSGLALVLLGAMSLVGLGVFIMFIMVLIKLFQKEGVGLGILGFICGIYAFIWGWINNKQQALTTVMIVWSILWIIQICLSSVYSFTVGQAIVKYMGDLSTIYR